MSRAIKSGATNSSFFKGPDDSCKHDNDRAERHSLIVSELDKDYNLQLKHLKHVAQEASLHFNGFNRPHTGDLDKQTK